ncbi:SDR family oxidoreductase [Candidatus Pelagibacter sp.]|nr:SDR family oxidoreductase [Candidatus Pelagibacter sp.]
MLLKNKSAVITGCNRGIGKKILEVFSSNGADIFACVRKIDKKFTSEIKDLVGKFNNNIIPIELDLEDIDKTKRAAKNILDRSNNIEILVNNAGMVENSIFQMTKLESIKKIFDINFFSQMVFTQLILKSLIKNKKGSIVYISSTSALDGNIGRNAYSSSKAAIITQAKTLSRELGKLQIRVNVIAPGLTKTDMAEKNSPDNVFKEVISNSSLKRVGETEDVANTALFLASDLSSYITGQTIRVDGGM